MTDIPKGEASALAPKLAAPQHKPRPLPLFLDLVRARTAGNPARLGATLAGLRAYQEAPRAAPPPLKPAIAQIMGASLRDYGGKGRPVLFIPSLINPPNVLDLGGEKSLLRWLAMRGHHVLLLDWGTDVEARRELGVAGHVEAIALPFLRELQEPPALVGYCLGGTMAVAAAALANVRALVTIAAPWRFSGFPDEARAQLLQLWTSAAPTVAGLGVFPMELLQSAFWSLDPERTVAKFERFAGLPPQSDAARAFVQLEDWANDGPPLPGAAAAEMFEGFFRDDRPGRSSWSVGGRTIAPHRLRCPLLDIVSTSDRIVPAGTASGAGHRIELALGHVGMVAGSRARANLWEPLHAWLSRTPPS